MKLSKIKQVIRKGWKKAIALILGSLSVLFVLQDVRASFAIPNSYSPYIVVVPVTIAIVLKLLCIQKKCSAMVNMICFAIWLAIIEYLGLVLFGKTEFDPNVKIFIYLVTALYLLIYSRIEKDTKGEHSKCEQQENAEKIFSLYYINTDKVYEIAMLLNNKVVTGGTRENEVETNIDRQTNIGINTNLSYLEAVKGELGVSQNTKIHNGIKNKVLENFDVKTTKSNMLSNIIARAKIYEDNQQADLGDLILLKNASLKLLNGEESYAVTKMILNGAFKDTKISSNSDDLKMEFDLSAMINSLLKDCVYELGCTVRDKKFLLTIPMTFENDFENSYNIYDLQVGAVTIVGIYRGMRRYEKRLSLQDIFTDNNDNKIRISYEDDEYQLQSSTQKEKKIIGDNNDSQLSDYQEVIDVIAVIQEINAK